MIGYLQDPDGTKVFPAGMESSESDTRTLKKSLQPERSSDKKTEEELKRRITDLESRLEQKVPVITEVHVARVHSFCYKFQYGVCNKWNLAQWVESQ